MIKAKYIYAACFCLMAANVCAGNKTCAQKKAEIESRIAIAENYGRTMKVHGLKKALSKLEKNCTDEELLQKHQNKIKDTRTDMTGGEVTPTGLPESNVLYYELSNNAWCCVRPSGTEPKIKFYFGVVGTDIKDSEKKLDELRNAMLTYAGE